MPQRKVSSKRIDGVLDGLVPTGIFGCQRLQVARRRPGFLRFGIGRNERDHIDQPSTSDGIQQEAPTGAQPKRGILQITGPRQPLGGNEPPVGHDSFAAWPALQADLTLHNRANSVGADHEVGFRGDTVGKRKTDSIGCFLEPDAPVAESDGPSRQRVKKQVQKIGAMNVVTLLASRKRGGRRPRGRGYRLALRRTQNDAANRRTDLLKLIFETDASQQPGRVRVDRNPGSDLPQDLGLLEYRDIEASRSKRKRGGQAADTATDYGNAKRARHFPNPCC
jgi:hypothetical protein